MAEILVGTEVIKRIGDLDHYLTETHENISFLLTDNDYFHPRHVFSRIICIVAVAWTLGRLVIAQYTWRFFTTRLTCHSRFRRVAPVRQRTNFSFRLYGISSLHGFGNSPCD
jgi:hypothetical protein